MVRSEQSSPAPHAIRIVAAFALWLGCAPDFDDPSTVKDLRVLAVVADVPEILVDDFDALPDVFPTVTFRPLVVDPRGQGRPVRFRVVACPNGSPTSDRGRDEGPGRVRDTIARGPCPPDSLAVASGEVTPLESTAPVAPIEFSFTPTRAFVEQALRSDPLGRLFGLPIVFELTVEAGDESAIAIKRIVFSPRLDATQIPNRNPTVTGLTFRARRGDEPKPLQALDAPPEVGLGGSLIFEPTPGQAEPYQSWVYRRGDGNLIVDSIEKETLRFAFFATIGSFSPSTVSTEPPLLRTGRPPGLDVTYEAPKALAPGDGDRVDIWIIVRDERAGSSFVRASLRLR